MSAALSRTIADLCRQIDERDAIIAAQREKIAKPYDSGNVPITLYNNIPPSDCQHTHREVWLDPSGLIRQSRCMDCGTECLRDVARRYSA